MAINKSRQRLHEIMSRVDGNFKMDDVDTNEDGNEMERYAEKLNAQQLSHNGVDDALDTANRIFEGYGIEPISDPKDFAGSYYRDIVGLYVNMGDTYMKTIIYDTKESKFVAMSWGDFVEARENYFDVEDNADEQQETGEEEINEIGPKAAGIALHRNLGGDMRTKQIQKDAVASLFSKYIGKNIPFFLMVREGDKPTKFELSEVTIGRNSNMGNQPSGENNDYVLNLYLHNDNGVEDDAPYAENKSDIILTYAIGKDSYINDVYHYNQYAVNMMLYAAMAARKTYYNAFPVYLDGKIDQNATDAKMQTRLNKKSFRMFAYDSKNMENRSNVKTPEDEINW